MLKTSATLGGCASSGAGVVLILQGPPPESSSAGQPWAPLPPTPPLQGGPGPNLLLEFNSLLPSPQTDPHLVCPVIYRLKPPAHGDGLVAGEGGGGHSKGQGGATAPRLCTWGTGSIREGRTS